MGERPEVAHDHAEAVVEGHRQARHVVLGESSSSVTKKPLLRMLWCESVAPLGKPVVPLVYWMLIGSSKDSVGHARGDRVAVGLAGAELVPLRAVDEDGPLERVDAAGDLVDHGARSRWS